METKQVQALIFGSILIGFGLGYGVSLFLIPAPEVEIIEKIIYEPQINLLRDWYMTGERGKITMTNQHYSMISGPLLRGISLELINCSNIVVHQPFIWTNYSYGIKITGCINISVIDFRILDADIGIIVHNSSDIDLGSPTSYDEDGNPIYRSSIENWESYAFEVLDSYRVSISGVNVTNPNGDFFPIGGS